MSIGPVGSAIYANQQTPFVSAATADHQAKFELQNIMAQHIANEKEKEIQAVRETEENQEIDPERESSKEEQEQKEKKEKKEQEDSSKPLHQLDILV